MNNTLDPVLDLVKSIHKEHDITPEEACLLIDLISKREVGRYVDLGKLISPYDTPRYIKAKTLSRQELGDKAHLLISGGAEDLYKISSYSFDFEKTDPALQQRTDENYFSESYEGDGFTLILDAITFFTHHKNESGHKMPELHCYTIIFP